MRAMLLPCLVSSLGLFAACSGATAVGAPAKTPSLSLNASMNADAFTLCATITNNSTKPGLITSPFSFRVKSQLYLGFRTMDGRPASTTSPITALSSSLVYYSKDRLNYILLDPGVSMTACTRRQYAEFNDKVMDVDVKFLPWLQAWMPLPFNDTELKDYEHPLLDSAPLTSNACRIDITKRLADCHF